MKLTKRKPKFDVSGIPAHAKWLSRSLYRFVKAAWHILVRNHKFVDGWHVRAICDHLQAVTEGRIKNLLINIPPRHTKSLIVSVFWPAWVWARNASVQWLYASKTQNVSLRDNRKCRLLLEDPWYQARWPNVQLATDQNVKSYYATTDGGHRLATSAGSQNTGLDADIMVVDDLHGINDGEEQISKDVEWCEDTFWSRGNTEEAPKVVIGQRVRGNDISSHILEGKASGDWVALVLPMEYESKRHCKTGLVTENFPNGFEDPRTREGEILAPERRSQRWVDEYRSKKPLSHARLNQQNPSPAEGGVWKRDWLTNRYRVLPFEKVSLWGTSTDSPFKGKQRSKSGEPDYYAQTMIAEVKENVVFEEWDESKQDFVKKMKTIIHYYFLGCNHEQLGYTKMKTEFREFIEYWDRVLGGAIGRNLIEDKANGSALIEDMSPVVPNIVAFEPGKISKELRFELVAPTVSAMRLHFPAKGAIITRNGEKIHEIDTDFVDEMIEEFASIPTAKFDDQADTFAQWDLHNRYGDTTPDPIGEIAAPSVDVFTVERRRRF